MRRRNVWDDLGDAAVAEGPAPPAFEARQRGASPLGRVVEGQQDPRPDFDPNDPPPPFPEDAIPIDGAERPRSPPPSFDVAVAQLQVNAQIRRASSSVRRASSVRSGSDRSEASDSGPWTEDEERLREERAAWEKDIANGLSFEERLAKVAVRLEALEASGNEDAANDAPSNHEDATAVATDEAPTTLVATSNNETRHDIDSVEKAEDVVNTDSFVEAEPVSRFSKEEKGKGKAVEDRKEAFGQSKNMKEREPSSSTDEVNVGSDEERRTNGVDAVAAASTPVIAETERPSRSYIAQSPRQSTSLPKTADKDKVGASAAASASLAQQLPLGQEPSQLPAPTSLEPSSPAPERPLPAVPQPLFHRKPSGGRESNPWKLLRKMSSAGPASPAMDSSASPPQSPNLSQRQNSDSWTPDRQSLGRTPSNGDDRPKSSRRPSALSRMTSQLFKPNLGQEPSSRTEKGAGQAGQDGEKLADDEKVEDLQSSPKIASSPNLESREFIRCHT